MFLRPSGQTAEWLLKTDLKTNVNKYSSNNKIQMKLRFPSNVYSRAYNNQATTTKQTAATSPTLHLLFK